MEKNKFNAIDGMYGYLIGLFAYQIFSFISLLFLNQFGLVEKIYDSALLIIAVSTFGEIAFLVPLFIQKSKGKNIKNAIKFSTKLDLKAIMLCILIGLIAIYSFSGLSNVVTYALEKIGFDTSSGVAIKLDSFSDFVLMLLGIGIVPAVCEELFIRGLCYNGLSEKGHKFAIIVSGFMFMFMHMNLLQSIYQLFLGILFAYVLYLTGNILYTMIMHCFNNSLVIIIAYLMKNLYPETESATTSINGFMDIVMPLIYVVVGLIAITEIVKLLKARIALLNQQNTVENKNESNSEISGTQTLLKDPNTVFEENQTPFENETAICKTEYGDIYLANEKYIDKKDYEKQFIKATIFTTATTLLLYLFYNIVNFVQ